MIAPELSGPLDALRRATTGTTVRRPHPAPHFAAAAIVAVLCVAAAPWWGVVTVPAIAAVAWRWWLHTPMTEHTGASK